MLALTLFKLKPGRSVNDYREYSEGTIRPGMNAMPSVVSFRDAAVTAAMREDPCGWQLVEVIEITSASDFQRDNSEQPGKAVADDWALWVDDYAVVFCEEL